MQGSGPLPTPPPSATGSSDCILKVFCLETYQLTFLKNIFLKYKNKQGLSSHIEHRLIAMCLASVDYWKETVFVVKLNPNRVDYTMGLVKFMSRYHRYLF